MTFLWTKDNIAITPDYVPVTTTLFVTVVCWKEERGGDVKSYCNLNS